MEPTRDKTARAVAAVLAALGLSLQPAQGQVGNAVEALNGSVAADWSYGDGPYMTTQSYGVSAALNVPLWRFLGASASASTYRTRTNADFSDLLLGGPYAWSNGDTTLGAALFARTPELGRFGFSYREAVQAKQFAYAGEAQAYLSRWTVAAGVERIGSRDVWSSPTTRTRMAANVYQAGASFYPIDALRLDARVNFLERNEERIYMAGIEWLPAAWRLPISARFSYARITGDSISSTNNVYGLSVTYFFAPAVSLQTLDRSYR